MITSVSPPPPPLPPPRPTPPPLLMYRVLQNFYDKTVENLLCLGLTKKRNRLQPTFSSSQQRFLLKLKNNKKPIVVRTDVNSQRVLRSVDVTIKLAWTQRRIQQICDK